MMFLTQREKIEKFYICFVAGGVKMKFIKKYIVPNQPNKWDDMNSDLRKTSKVFMHEIHKMKIKEDYEDYFEKVIKNVEL